MFWPENLHEKAQSLIGAGGADMADRNASLDWLRFLAAVVIVLFHARAPGGRLVEAALAVFVLATVFHVRGDQPAVPFLRRRAERLLLPFLVWGLFYGGLVAADAVVSRESVVGDLLLWLPPVGSMGQLWFLPFAFFACVVAWLLQSTVDRLDSPGFLLVLVGLGVASIGWHELWSGLGLPPGIRVYGNHLPLIGFGLLLSAREGLRDCLLVAGVAVLVGLAIRYLGAGPSLAYLLGVPLFCLVIRLPMPANALSALAASLSMAVYLVHPFCLALVERAGAAIGAQLGWGTVVASVLLSLLLLRTRLRPLLT